MLKIQVNSNATTQMQNVINKVGTYPNRIASAQISGIRRSEGQIIKELSSISKAAKYLKFEIRENGKLGARITLSPPGKENIDSYYAAVTFITGRKGGKIIRSKSGKLMKLREESVRQGYPEYLRVAKLGALPSYKKEIKEISRYAVIESIQYALSRFGFGPRGGATGLEDLSSVRSRAK